MSLAKPKAGYTVSAESIPAMGPTSERYRVVGMNVRGTAFKFETIVRYKTEQMHVILTSIILCCREILSDACHGLCRGLPVCVGVSLPVTSECLGHDLDIGVVAGHERGIDERMRCSSDGQGLVLSNNRWIWRWPVVHLSEQR
jgi:hypothetical protein